MSRPSVPPEQEDEFLRLWDSIRQSGGTTQDLADRWGVTRRTVTNVLGRLGAQRGPHRAAWVDTAPLGEKPDDEIAADLGISRQRVSAVRRSRGIPLPTAEGPAD